MTPTPELKALLLKELSTHHDLKKLCLTWDIENINDYISLTATSESKDINLSLKTSTPAGFNPPRLRQSHSISTFG